MSLGIAPGQPFFLFRRKNSPRVSLCKGSISRSRALDDLPLKSGVPGKEVLDSVSLIPFSQARERGWPVHDDNDEVVTLNIEDSAEYPVQDVVDVLPALPITLEGTSFDTTSKEYEDTIRKILNEEIGTGQGANFVIARRCDVTAEGFSLEHALSLFRSFLVHEFGTYWTFLFYDGESFVMGATPERHISVRGGEVAMNPISGTFRKSAGRSVDEEALELLRFLDDEKEIFELFMVTDEELKIMSEICDEGGVIVGPLLKEMAHLVHTEYLLIGRTTRSPIEVLRGSMYAPTVAGSPLTSAFRVIHRFEKESRSYYGAMIALLGRDAQGEPTIDAPITIRTLEAGKDGRLSIRVGATLVRGSDPAAEVAETESKIAGVLGAIRSSGEAPPPRSRLLDVVDNEQIQIRLQRRNLYLSRFWFEPQSPDFNAVPALMGKTVTIIDAEDGFSTMLGRMIQQMGAQVRVVSFADYDDSQLSDITIAGPGPGDPADTNDPKIARMEQIIRELWSTRRPLFAECLSHQILCRTLGMDIVRKTTPFQGAQDVIDLFGQSERVGFYNTFAAKAPQQLPPGVELSVDGETGLVHALRAPGLYSAQFHAESILTPRGYEIVRDALSSLLPSS